MAHTPGPWCYEHVGEKHNAAIVGVAHRVDANGEVVYGAMEGCLEPWDDDGKEIEYYREAVCTLDDSEVQGDVFANAALIAAAPDLYNALRAMVDRWEPDTEGSDRRMWVAARAALDRAVGRKPEIEQ